MLFLLKIYFNMKNRNTLFIAYTLYQPPMYTLRSVMQLNSTFFISNQILGPFNKI